MIGLVPMKNFLCFVNILNDFLPIVRVYKTLEPLSNPFTNGFVVRAVLRDDPVFLTSFQVDIDLAEAQGIGLSSCPVDVREEAALTEEIIQDLGLPVARFEFHETILYQPGV